jgi:hypothetical protein
VLTLHDAFTEAGASEESARKAAETLANYDNRLARIETDLTTLRTEIRGEFMQVKWTFCRKVSEPYYIMEYIIDNTTI